jgi:hypothetical protein
MKGQITLDMFGNDLNRIITTGEAEITDASTCQICIHLGNDKYFYMQPKTISDFESVPSASSIIHKAKNGLLEESDYDRFRIEEIDYKDISDKIRKSIVKTYGILPEENYTPEYYRQLVVEGVFEQEILL